MTRSSFTRLTADFGSVEPDSANEAVPPAAARPPRVGLPALLLVVWCGSMPGCNGGTEGDNPFSGPVDASPCKGDAEYADYLARANGRLAPFGSERSTNFDVNEQALVAQREMPIGLECVEWEYSGESLQLVVSNFTSGCAIEWEGETRLVAPGEIVMTLRNPSCEVARCGSCAYDARSEVNGPRADLLGLDGETRRVTLEVRDCNGEPSDSISWQLGPNSERGIRCEPVDGWAWLYGKSSSSDLFDETQLNLYAVCGEAEGAVECTEDRSCNGGYCVPACSATEDCPLGGALTCQDGACLLP